jgi:putative ABC transport system substrate-binding protein
MLGGTAVWPLAARAQQPAKLPVIGFLGVDASVEQSWIAAFVGRLRELGWIEGRTVTIDYRWGEGSHERNAAITGLKCNIVQLKLSLAKNPVQYGSLVEADGYRIRACWDSS